jgi:integrase
MTSDSRRGWRERVELGVYRSHRVACLSSRDRRPGRRCGCAFQVSVPGPAGGSTLVSLEPGASLGDARAEKRRRMAAGRPLPPDASSRPRTVHELAVVYLRDREPLLAPATIRTTADGYRLRVAPHLGATPLERLSRPAVERWVGRLLSTGSSAHATRKALAALKVMCSYGVELGALEANPCARVRVPEPPHDPTAPPAPVSRVLSPAELELLLAACVSPREEVVVRLAVESGLRSGEVRGLRWPDVELAARRLHVRRAVWRDVVKVPKGRRRRRVAMTAALADALSRLYAALVVERGLPADGYVLPSRDGLGPCGDDTPLELVQRVQVRTGLVQTRAGRRRPRVTFHELRHTAASLMLTAGVSPVVVARQLGHASSAITTSVYEHLLDDGLLDEAVSSVRVAGGVAVAIEHEPETAPDRS